MTALKPEQEQTLNKIWDSTSSLLLLTKPITAEKLQYLWQWTSIPTYKRDLSQEQQDLLRVGLLALKLRHLSYIEETARCLAMDDIYLLGCLSSPSPFTTIKYYLLGSISRHIPHLKAEFQEIDSIDLAIAISKSKEILANYDHQQSY